MTEAFNGKVSSQPSQFWTGNQNIPGTWELSMDSGICVACVKILFGVTKYNNLPIACSVAFDKTTLFYVHCWSC